MVFVIQNTQNRDAKATKLQLDELINSMKTASNDYVDLDDLSDEELDKLVDHFHNMHTKVAIHREKRKKS